MHVRSCYKMQEASSETMFLSLVIVYLTIRSRLLRDVSRVIRKSNVASRYVYTCVSVYASISRKGTNYYF